MPTLQCPELFHSAQALRLAPILADAYREELVARDLLESAIAGSSDPRIHGGPSPEETITHFSFRFPNSASRVVCVCVDPKQCFASLPAQILQSFSSHKIAVLDAPCGAGASLLSLLSVISSAREQKQIPCLPLTVGVVAADISPTALDIYSSLVRRIEPHLSAAGIFVELSTYPWDAARANQTSGLCDAWFSIHPDANEYFVLIGNLSGVANSLFEALERSFVHITERISNRPSTVLWLEPAVKTTLFERLFGMFSKAPWLRQPQNSPPNPQCKFTWWQPIQGKELPGKVTVHRFERFEGGS
ncbi:MAG: hypothetical protein ACKVP0_03360 [Pirellulaceae bacterium]